MADTNIEWADKVWNPVLGCARVSSGCGTADEGGCYAERLAFRLALMGKREYEGLTRQLPNGKVRWTGKVVCLPDRLAQPLTWKKPSRIFVNSMSDLFHEDVPDDFIDQVFSVMAWTPRHSYLVLTKRPERMLRYLTSPDRRELIENARCDTCVRWGGLCGYPGEDCGLPADTILPLSNTWLGVSTEDQRTADERVPLLLQTPAAVRFLSCEPLLGPIDLERITLEDGFCDARTGEHWIEDDLGYHASVDGPDWEPIDWVIAGGESGPNFRALNLDWARSLRDQCQAVGVAFHFKQVGGHTHAAGGRELDGRTWDEFPEPKRELARV